MRKSRVVNLGDNILCETFLFLVQRELQRQQGRATHFHCLPQSTQSCRQTGVAVVLPPLRTARVANRTENGAYSVLAVFGQSKSKGAGEKKQQLWPVTCAPSPYSSPSTRCGGVCVCCCCCGGAAVATFYCFCCIAKQQQQQRRSGPCGGGWACWSWWFRGCSV